MTAEEEEYYDFTEEDCPYDCEACPYGLTAMECDDLYDEFMGIYHEKNTQ